MNTRSMPRKRCPGGHPYTPENTIARVNRVWSKTLGAWKAYTVRSCRRCYRMTWRLNGRRRRALGKQLSYPQWLAQRKDAR